MSITVTLEQPDIILGLRPNAFAPSVARRVLSHIGDPHPDLRDSIDAIVANLVTRACELRPVASERIGLRAWHRGEIVRVEVEAAGTTQEPVPRGTRWTEDDIELFELLADRWGIDYPSQADTVVWFEIDRPPV